jgi:hypothetical protein
MATSGGPMAAAAFRRLFHNGKVPHGLGSRRSASGGHSFSNRCLHAPNREVAGGGKTVAGFCSGGTPVMPRLKGEVAGVRFITAVLLVAPPCSGDQRTRRNGDDRRLAWSSGGGASFGRRRARRKAATRALGSSAI